MNDFSGLEIQKFYGSLNRGHLQACLRLGSIEHKRSSLENSNYQMMKLFLVFFTGVDVFKDLDNVRFSFVKDHNSFIITTCCQQISIVWTNIDRVGPVCKKNN